MTFTCSATGIPPPEINWVRNGVPFDQRNIWVTLSDYSEQIYSTYACGENIFLVSRNLTLDNAMDGDSGTYTCVASNGNAVTPMVTQNFQLFVNGMFDITDMLVPNLGLRIQLLITHICSMFLPSCPHHL